MPIEIREASADDLDDLALLRWLSHAESDREVVETFDEYRLGFARWWSAQEGRTRAIVGVDDGRVVGMGFLAVVNRVPVPDALNRHHGDLQSLYVLPEYRGRGTGAQIVGALVDLARATGCDRVNVHSGRRAVPLYERAGFERFARLMNLDLTG